MAAPPSSRLQKMLQAAVQSVQWTYSLFWQICPQQGILIWSDGYYNGAIKTRKTVQPMEVSTEEASLQRSQQLRELYESLSSDETNQPARRPCAALSPEDLTESEWFYLMCVSFSFAPGVGLPGKAYARRQHIWLTGANEVDSKTFSRAILAKSACIQTVLCIPLLDGVLELGSTEKVQEDLGLVQHVKTFFNDGQTTTPPPPKPALSEHSTSNPAASSDQTRFRSPSVPPLCSEADPPINAAQEDDDNVDDDDDEEDNDEDEEPDSYSAETGRNSLQVPTHNIQAVAAGMADEPSELMQLEMSEDIKLGSPDDASDNLDSDFHMLAVSQSGNPADQQRRDESNLRWQMLQEPPCSGLQPPSTGPQPLHELSQEDTQYSQTVSSILQAQPTRWAESPSTKFAATYSATQSAFSNWTTRSDHHLHSAVVEGTSQWLLKYILFTVPFLHTKYRDENSPKLRESDAAAAARFRKGTPQEELSANHVLAERRRREKLNERFIILRSLVPFVTKMDKASILGDTIEYVKQLRKKIQDLETRNRQMEADNERSRSADSALRTSTSFKDQRSGVTTRSSGPDKKKMRVVEGSGGGTRPKTVETPPQTMETSVEVSIIESDALLELQCGYREGLLLDIMQMLREKLRIEITAVQSSSNNGLFVAELRAKVKDNMKGKKVSIMEVKRAINQVIPQS
ncbi:hypothetical protein V6N12_066399 [Hibiscus sabdariffa]|uniref:BHLH domain-containing protein n=1 Tax=Hibiscus sabdariffa TaxID=183260 RepID=A0ABR2CPZ9_9ROSI